MGAASAEASYGYQLPASGLGAWPSTSHGYGSSSTVYGAHGYRIGKRSADASYGYGIGYGIALPTTLENRNNVHGHEYASQYAISQPHPGHSGSYQQVSRVHSGLHYGGYYGKRSAEAFYGHGGVAVHPGHAVSSTHRSAQGLSLGYGHGYGHGFYGYGKRSADAYYGAATSAYAVNQAHPGHAGSYQQVSRLHSGIGYGYGGYLY